MTLNASLSPQTTSSPKVTLVISVLIKETFDSFFTSKRTFSFPSNSEYLNVVSSLNLVCEKFASLLNLTLSKYVRPENSVLLKSTGPEKIVPRKYASLLNTADAKFIFFKNFTEVNKAGLTKPTL